MTPEGPGPATPDHVPVIEHSTEWVHRSAGGLGAAVIENPLRGIALMVAATVCFSLSDAMAKYLVASVPAIEIAWIRYIVFTLIALMPAMRGGRAIARTRRPGLQALRGLGIVTSAVFFIMALGHLPLAEASTLSFASPLFITVLAVPLLGEVVRRATWISVLAGFLGVLIVVRPGVGGFHPAALLVVLSSASWAVSMILTRRSAGTERPTATLLWTALTGLVVLTLMMPLVGAPVAPGQLGVAILLGVAASCGQFLAILAYRHAAASVLAPLSYGQLIWSSCLGFLAFGAVPDAWTLVGASIIVASGLTIIQSERRRRRRAMSRVLQPGL